MSRSYVSEATNTDERIGAMGSISAAQALGFVVGPGKCTQLCLLILVTFSREGEY